MRRRLTREAAVLVALLFVGCGEYAPIVESARDVRRLPPEEMSVRARGLPDEAVVELGRLRELEIIDFCGGFAAGDLQLTDAGLQVLGTLRLPKLRHVSLCRSNAITNDGIVALASHRGLRSLSIGECPRVGDAGIEALAALSDLESLWLGDFPLVTDRALEALGGLQHLKRLQVGWAPGITQEGIDRLRARLPKTRITRTAYTGQPTGEAAR